MQCYERQATYIKLYLDARSFYPELRFDRELLDEVLSDFAIEHFATFASMDPQLVEELVLILKLRSDINTYARQHGDAPDSGLVAA